MSSLPSYHCNILLNLMSAREKLMYRETIPLSCGVILLYSRKEKAVVNIVSACSLVKAIALGQRIPKEGEAIAAMLIVAHVALTTSIETIGLGP